MIEIDGRMGEGGGQVLRTSLTLSSLLMLPVHIHDIRAGRERPGLMPQHFTVVKALSEITNAEVEGLVVGSRELFFKPKERKSGNFLFDIKTAGSASLVLQAVIPVLLFSEKQSGVEVVGGTHVMKSPNYDFFSNVFLQSIGKMGCNVKSELRKAGFYPKGGGDVLVEISPVDRVKPISATEKKEEKINAVIRSSNLPPHIGEREERVIKERFPDSATQVINEKGACPGNSVTIYSGFLSCSSLGEVGKPAEEVAREACEGFKNEFDSGFPVGRRLADQLLPYMAIADGRSEIMTTEITLHTKTNVSVIEHFIKNRFLTKGNSISIDGIGMKR